MFSGIKIINKDDLRYQVSMKITNWLNGSTTHVSEHITLWMWIELPDNLHLMLTTHTKFHYTPSKSMEVVCSMKFSDIYQPTNQPATNQSTGQTTNNPLTTINPLQTLFVVVSKVDTNPHKHEKYKETSRCQAGLFLKFLPVQLSVYLDSPSLPLPYPHLQQNSKPWA